VTLELVFEVGAFTRQLAYVAATKHSRCRECMQPTDWKKKEKEKRKKSHHHGAKFRDWLRF
jgi:hypothetical protein